MFQDTDLVKTVAKDKADRQMEDFVTDFENRIRAIRDAKKKVGREEAVARYVPTCKSFSNLYCLGTYTYSLNAAMKKNGDDPKSYGFLDRGTKNNPNEDYAYARWGSPQTATYAAIAYFDTNKNEDFKKCGKSLKDAKPGTTLGDMLKQGYEDGSIPVGSLVMIQRVDKEGNPLLHATMFAGFNEKGEPLFSCANPEKIREPVPQWANQKTEARRSRDKECYVINMHRALQTKIAMAERDNLKTMGKEAYYEAHAAEVKKLQTNEAAKADGITPIRPAGLSARDSQFKDVKTVAGRIKKAAQRTGEDLAVSGQHDGEQARLIRQEIRSRAKARCEKKTLARIEGGKNREDVAQKSAKSLNTLLRNVPAQDHTAEKNTSNTPEIQRSPVSVALLRNRMVAGRG